MRISHHSLSSLFYQASKWIIIGFIFLIGISTLIGRNASASTDKLIPEDAIRIRIIANSDGKSDQSLKNNVRDDVAAYIQTWGGMPDTYDEAYRLIQKRLPKIQKRVDALLLEAGVPYGAKVELAKVPFPEKVFDGEKYAAGDYEALRITLGQGSGKNWWCVLFPPLCLTAATAKEDLTPAGDIKSLSATGKAANDSSEGAEPKAKFFLWELLQKLFAFIAALFS
ncbi:stage II sporulation protein R [Cohnella mopanensis]|uniref:stage II sporulation protein R n=1 Tax=Cohnella mopanensis TaxID=2911966 RepID=UPI001EF9676A|nr:stage II sporulation protein R [Cohnella mopanensis]